MTENDNEAGGRRQRAPHEPWTAPYEREPDRPRDDVDHGRPWGQAGRSWAAQADRLQVYYRTNGTMLERARAGLGRGLGDVDALRARAHACRRAGRTLDRLTASGWVVWHDRRLAGTEETIDHVLVGPDGLTCVSSVYPAGQVGGVPVAATTHHARARLASLTDAVIDAKDTVLPAWDVLLYTVVVVDGKTFRVQTPAPQVVTRGDVCAEISSHPRGWSPMQITDAAMALESVFPYAPLGRQ